ncbi:MAG: phosphoribosylanthranilate isomerase, partial [Candidatus Thioglobus sp.]
GGLNPATVAEAISQVNPYAVDVSSGVESSKGIKDIAKIKQFVNSVK